MVGAETEPGVRDRHLQSFKREERDTKMKKKEREKMRAKISMIKKMKSRIHSDK